MSRDGDYVAESIYSPFTEDTGATRVRVAGGVTLALRKHESLGCMFASLPKCA